MLFYKNNNKGIMSLAVVFVIGFFGLGLVLTVATVALAGINKNYNTNSGNQTFYTAETAVREGIYQYLADDSYATGTFNQPINNISTSSIPISVTSSWPYIGVEGTAENNLNNRRVRSALLLFPAGAAFDYAVYAEKELTIHGGHNTLIIGDTFSNGTTTCGGNPHIQGNAYSSGNIENCEGNASSTHESVDSVPPPDIDPNYYKSRANCTSTADDVKDDCLSVPTTSVVFVDDPGEEANLQNINLTGNLTVIGDLSLGSGDFVSSTEDYAAVVVQGDLKITGHTTIYGLVYVTGTTTFSGGNNTIYGSLISVGGAETDIAGSVTIDYQGPSGPPGGIDDSGPPEIIGWEEM